MLKKKLKKLNIPTHIAFIMDGNRRWAKNRGLDKMAGHQRGALALKNIIKTIYEIKEIKYVSFFGFSTENWNREQREIDYLFDISCQILEENYQKFSEKNIRFVSMGDLSKFPQKMKDLLLKVMEETKNNSGLTIYLGLNYGGRDDIVYSVNNLLKQGEAVTEQNILKNLYCPHNIDLLVRTSGEQRVSNFMLYQMAYAEMYFPKKHWPSFNDRQLLKALKVFSRRNRRFGGK